MLPDWVSNPGSLNYESGALPIALRGPAPEREALIIIHLHMHSLFEAQIKMRTRCVFEIFPIPFYVTIHCGIPLEPPR